MSPTQNMDQFITQLGLTAEREKHARNIARIILEEMVAEVQVGMAMINQPFDLDTIQAALAIAYRAMEQHRRQAA